LNIAILGSTGSIGVCALNVIKNHKDRFKVSAISGHGNLDLLKQQINEFHPKICVITDENQRGFINKEDFKGTKIIFGCDGLIEAAISAETDILLAATTGLASLSPCIQAIKAKKRIALANKEILVAAGEYIIQTALKYKCEIIPVDSEHSAIFQCLQGVPGKYLKRIILTASGGAFRDLKKDELKKVTAQMALNHPNWNMGKKITIDSATLMNKGLEVIEAKWLFNLSPDEIECIMHPQSVIHSMVEFTDNSVIAQMSYPSMEIPVQLALTYPERLPVSLKPLDFKTLKSLDFKEIDTEKYPCLNLAYSALKKGGLYPAILNSANDEAVRLFLEGKIGFTEIPAVIEKALEKFDGGIKAEPESVYYIDKQIKSFIADIYG
jgi:1-deoxy-D-xylulose-5-phosphate reductoisomerase